MRRVDRDSKSWSLLLSLAVLAFLLAASLAGCGPKAGYPTERSVTVLNQPGECAYCHRKIDRVGPENLVTYDGVEYVICDAKCAANQKIAAER